MKLNHLLSSILLLSFFILTTACQKELASSAKQDALLTIGEMLRSSNEGMSLNQEQLSTTRNNNGGTPSNPLAFARSNAKFSVLTSALARTGLLNTLMKLEGDYTLFAPTDEAFAAAGISVSDLNKLPIEDLSKILLYHVVAGKIQAASVPVTAAVETLMERKYLSGKQEVQ